MTEGLRFGVDRPVNSPDIRMMTSEPEPACLCCRRNVPTAGRRQCPECDHVFNGSGWDGVDAHWRAHHEGVMTYREFKDTLCGEHRGPLMT